MSVTNLEQPAERISSRGEVSYGRGETWGAVASEWTKLWSVRATRWCLAGSLGLMVLFAPALGNSIGNSYRDDHKSGLIPIAHPSVMSVNLVQFSLLSLAILAITSEYSTGSIRTTLQCVPRRGRLLFAKTAVIVPTAGVAGIVIGALGSLCTWPLLFEFADTDAADAIASVIYIGVYFALMGAFCIGVGAAVRSAVGTLTTVFVVLAGLPGALAISSTDLTQKIMDYLPSIAGQHMMDGDTDPYGRARALVIILVWVALAQLAGYLTLQRRDA